MEGVDCALNAALLCRGSGVNGGHLVDSISGLAKFSLGLSLASLGRVQEGPGLLHLSSESIGASVSEAGLLGHLLADTGLLGQSTLGLSHLSLVPLDGLLGLVVGLVSVVKSDLKLVDFS